MRHSLLLLSVLSLVTVVHADFAPPESPRYGNMRDIMLAYMEPGHWAQQDFLPYVAYLDKTAGGAPRDWFYDAWLFLMFGGAPTGGDYINGSAKFGDWQFYVDQLFLPDRNLAALEACIEDVGRRLKSPGRVCRVIIMIPYLSPKVTDFGDVDGDGQAENPALDADRIKAFRWAVDAIVKRWGEHKYAHLQLDGCYWMNEGISGKDEAVGRATGQTLHEQGLNFHWIPWFAAPGYDKWRDLGFDLAIMQPNYAFMNVPAGAVVPDEDRLSQNANLARTGGLGVEMELDYATDTNPGHRLELQLYLNHGADELDGYMSNCARAYYQSYDSIAKLYASDNPEYNQLYGDLYRFHKGTYQRRPVSLAEGAACKLNGQSTPSLTDGLWLCRAEQSGRVRSALAPARVDVDLGATQIVGDVRVHVAARDDVAPAAPATLRVATSTDGVNYREGTEVACPPLGKSGDWRAGFALALFEPRFARHVRIELTGAAGQRLGVDEVVVFPASHLLWGVPAVVEGDLQPGSAPTGSTVLTDGRLAPQGQPAAAVRFRNGQGRVRFDLDESWVLQSAYVHFSTPGGKTAASCRVRIGAGETAQQSPLIEATAGNEGWLEIPLPSVAAGTITFDLAGGPDTAWDELQVRRAPNLAAGKPYRLDPPFPAQYPDTDGKELTDGVLTDKGFGDGRTVGWYDQPVSLLLDLGASRPVDAVRVHAQGGGYAAVHSPESFCVLGSEDGAKWRLLRDGAPEKEVTAAEKVGEELNELAWLKLAFPAAQARFLKLTFRPRSWLMLSEVEALSRDENVAAGCSYSLTSPTSTVKYADNSSRLTDGDYSRRGDGWSKAVGWSEGSPQVTIDLLQPTPVGIVRVHCLGGGNGGVYFPRFLTITTSLDGQTWSDPVQTDGPPPEPGGQTLTTFLTAELPGRPARFVRMQAERKGWAMLDEVEVLGAGPQGVSRSAAAVPR